MAKGNVHTNLVKFGHVGRETDKQTYCRVCSIASITLLMLLIHPQRALGNWNLIPSIILFRRILIVDVMNLR